MRSCRSKMFELEIVNVATLYLFFFSHIHCSHSLLDKILFRMTLKPFLMIVLNPRWPGNVKNFWILCFLHLALDCVGFSIYEFLSAQTIFWASILFSIQPAKILKLSILCQVISIKKNSPKYCHPTHPYRLISLMLKI